MIEFSKATCVTGHEQYISQFKNSEGRVNTLPERYVIITDDYYANYRTGNREWSEIAVKDASAQEPYIPRVGTLVDAESIGRDEPDMFYLVLAKFSYRSSGITDSDYSNTATLLLVRTSQKRLKRRVLRIDVKIREASDYRKAEARIEKVELKKYSKRVSENAYRASREREKRIKMATPSWACFRTISDLHTQVKRLNKAHGSVIWHLDHEVPIYGKDANGNHIVCGLNVQSNLVPIDATTNLKKSNKSWPNMP